MPNKSQSATTMLLAMFLEHYRLVRVSLRATGTPSYHWDRLKEQSCVGIQQYISVSIISLAAAGQPFTRERKGLGVMLVCELYLLQPEVLPNQIVPHYYWAIANTQADQPGARTILCSIIFLGLSLLFALTNLVLDRSSLVYHHKIPSPA